MTLLRASDYKRMPWKNGGGETVEIAVFPPAASVNDFDWRISMATVASDGPFSIFPGIDRTLSILQGNGMALSIAATDPLLLTMESDPLPFPADVPVNATLPAGPITDLNVMTRRSTFRHTVQRRSDIFSATAEGVTILVLALDPLTVSQGNEKNHLERLDSLLIEGGAPFIVKADQNAGAYFLITLKRL
ncbi:HutD family protein [Agrobacterium tumefaciens]|uniref:HutD/Ves family protein n=1 Tax=Agrobacterium tumefaciens TaxID=358 RepID=UPI00157162D3|nr:HutD family protein [Agrobacterium tumefaciens]NTE54565.1 HutD family protein [Agrobacterium tumefaciens]NTE73944.1 HutD family protein [Agrobacterium tumefaciens]